jgi:hypothetical protein
MQRFGKLVPAATDTSETMVQQQSNGVFYVVRAGSGQLVSCKSAQLRGGEEKTMRLVCKIAQLKVGL